MRLRMELRETDRTALAVILAAGQPLSQIPARAKPATLPADPMTVGMVHVSIPIRNPIGDLKVKTAFQVAFVSALLDAVKVFEM